MIFIIKPDGRIIIKIYISTLIHQFSDLMRFDGY